MPQNELHHPLPEFKVALGTGFVSHQRPSYFIVWTITIVEKLHQLQHSPTSGKNDFEKYFFKLINNAVIGKSFFIFMFICSFMLLCIDSFIDSFIAGKIFIFMFICSLNFLCFDSFIDSLIAGKAMENLSNRRTVD